MHRVMDMSAKTYRRIALSLCCAGVLFSGYLAGTRYFTNECAFGDPCPFFFGYPACYTGFTLFSTALLITLASLRAALGAAWPMIANLVVGTIGSLFAAKMALEELATRSSYRMGLPTCAYGFFFFLALAEISVIALRARPGHAAPRA